MATKLSQFAELTRTIHGLTRITTRAYFEDQVFAFYSHTPYPEWFKDPFESHKDLLLDPVDPITCFTTARHAHYGIIFSPPYALVLGPVLDPAVTEESRRVLLEAVTTDPDRQQSLSIILDNCPRMSLYSLMPLLLNTSNLIHFRDAAADGAPGNAIPEAGIPAEGDEDMTVVQKPASGSLIEDIDAGILLGDPASLSADELSRLYPHNVTSTEISYYDDENPMAETHHQSADTYFFEILRQGDVKSMAEWMLNPTFGFGQLPLAGDSLRNSKNNYILQCALLSMAALQGGLSRKRNDEILAKAIQKGEEMDNEADVMPLVGEVANRYTEEVRKMQDAGDRDSIIINTKRYIHTHLRSALRTEDIAEALFVSRSYLSQVFSEQTGQTLSSYVRQQKIKEAKRLLLNESYSLAQVSDMLCFSSQSYFTNVFKKFTGMTPKMYRDSR